MVAKQCINQLPNDLFCGLYYKSYDRQLVMLQIVASLTVVIDETR